MLKVKLVSLKMPIALFRVLPFEGTGDYFLKGFI